MSRHIRNSDREGEKEASFHDYQRGGAGGAREQRQRPPRQINLRRDLRSRTSLSAYVYARAPAGLACACRPYRSGGLSSIATKVSEGASDLTMRRGSWGSAVTDITPTLFVMSAWRVDKLW